LALFAILGLATAGYFLGLLPVGHGPHPKPLRVGWGRWVAAGLMVLLMVPVGLSLANRPSYQARNLPWVAAIALETVLPPAPTGDELARAEGWFVDDYDAALQKASAENRPLFIDFTGIYCGNCRAMEQTVFPLANIKSRLEEMVRVRLYVDRDDEKSIEYARLQSTRYGLSSQPFYVILDPRDEKTLASDGGFIRAETFEALLKQGLEKFQAGRRVASR
jgi:thiol:disulfide interchange protein DsbD